MFFIGYVFEMFIALQHAISTELTTRLTGEDLSEFLMNIQRYPHPEYLQDHGSDILNFLLPLFILIGISFPVSYMIQSVTMEKELQLKVTFYLLPANARTFFFVEVLLYICVTLWSCYH